MRGREREVERGSEREAEKERERGRGEHVSDWHMTGGFLSQPATNRSGLNASVKQDCAYYVCVSVCVCVCVCE